MLPDKHCRDWVNSVVEFQFPEIARRMKACVAAHEQQHNVICRFGMFWNLCINAPLFEKGVDEVICKAHCDAKNGGVLVCAVFVYYFGEGQ